MGASVSVLGSRQGQLACPPAPAALWTPSWVSSTASGQTELRRGSTGAPGFHAEDISHGQTAGGSTACRREKPRSSPTESPALQGAHPGGLSTRAPWRLLECPPPDPGKSRVPPASRLPDGVSGPCDLHANGAHAAPPPPDSGPARTRTHTHTLKPAQLAQPLLLPC